MNPDAEADRKALDLAGDTRRPSFLEFARRYARRRAARGLDGVWVAGLQEARAALAQRPLLFVANHVAWLDVLLLLILDEALGGTGWAVMDAANLHTVPFLGWVGALPLDRSSTENSARCLHSCADLLDRPRRGLWIFPQGRQRPAHLRPLDLKRGVQTLHAHNPVDVVTVSLNYVFLERPQPAAIVRFSAPIPGAAVAGEALLPAVENALLEGLTAIDDATVAATDGRRARTKPGDPLPGFVPLVRARKLVDAETLGGHLLEALRHRRSRGG